LPLLLPRLHAFFRTSLIDSTVTPSDGWLSFEDVPLKWHLPAGLLFDLYSGAKDRLQDENDGDKSTIAVGDSIAEPLPWKLTLHFSGWPEEQLPRLDRAGKVLEDAFTNSVKEVSNGIRPNSCTLEKLN
jgi:autophagy-related protein 5